MFPTQRNDESLRRPMCQLLCSDRYTLMVSIEILYRAPSICTIIIGYLNTCICVWIHT
jgi:hypothetical protein